MTGVQTCALPICIVERRIADASQTSSDLALEASRRALEAAGVAAADIDLIVLATSTPDYIFPSTACLLQSRLGSNGCAAFDVQAVCSGFVYALATADNFIKAGQANTVLLIGAEVFSRILDWNDRGTAVLFGDGAGAVVLRIDKEKERLSLGYKQLSRDPWEVEIPERYRVGGSVTGKVSKLTDFGVFIELESGVEGLIHISEAGLQPGTRLEEKFKPQDEVTAKIIKVDREERKIALSLREHQMDTDRKHMDEYHASQGTVDQSLGRAAKRSKKRNDQDGEEG